MPVIAPQPGPQTKAAKSKAGILVYGGGAGGGKSWFAAYRASKYHRTPGYNACLFRRTFTMLTGSGSLFDECMGFYPALGAKDTTRPLEFRWPDVPSRVEFRHLQHAGDELEHKSKQYGFLNFDEASDFLGQMFWFMNSRLRSIAGVPKQFLLTTNPDPDCYLRSLIGWWIGSDGFPIPDRDGVVRYFVRDPKTDELVWSADREGLRKYVDSDHEIESITFIKALVTDNQLLLERDPTYLAKLKGLPAIERARFLAGNWDVRESSGDMFQQAWFRQWGATELERRLMDQVGEGSRVVASVRWWDFAATPVKGDLVPGIERPADFKARDKTALKDDPDWTMGVRLDLTADGRVVVADVVYCRDTAGAVEQLVERTAMNDGRRVVQGWWEDPGQAAKYQSEKLAQRIGKFSTVVCEPAAKAKEQYAREPSRAAYAGRLFYVPGTWNAIFFNQLQLFPSDKKEDHDDAVDALSGAWHYLTNNAPAPIVTRMDEARLNAIGLVSPQQAIKNFMMPPVEPPNKRRRLTTKFGRRIL